jgi:DNA-binding NtrC family response regulator
VQTRVDCRLICATNRNLTQEVRRGRFRADLLERISDEYIQLAELRSRIHDLPELISTMQNEMGITPPYTFHVDAVQRMQSYAWPGNLRELHKTIARLSRREVVKHTRQVHASDLVFGLLGPDVDHPPLAEPVVAMSRPPSEPYGEGWVAADGPWALGSIHRQKSVLTSGRVEHALQAAQGNHTHAARLLGVKRTSLLRWLSVQRDVSTDPRATSRDSPRGGGGTKIR